jgi:hypothetical protein
MWSLLPPDTAVSVRLGSLAVRRSIVWGCDQDWGKAGWSLMRWLNFQEGHALCPKRPSPFPNGLFPCLEMNAWVGVGANLQG